MTSPLQKNLFDLSHKSSTAKFKAIDLFAGIGGIFLGFANAFR